MHEDGKSDSPVLPANPPNKALAAEVGEGRGLAEGNTTDPTRPGRSAGPDVSIGLERVREVARRGKDARFTALLHHVTLDRLHMAYEEIRPRAAAGVDGVTWGAYGVGLEERLLDLHRRVQSGSYRAKPSRRAYIPKRGRAVAAARHRGAGGQDRPACRRRGDPAATRTWRQPQAGRERPCWHKRPRQEPSPLGWRYGRAGSRPQGVHRGPAGGTLGDDDHYSAS